MAVQALKAGAVDILAKPFDDGIPQSRRAMRREEPPAPRLTCCRRGQQ